MGNFTVKQGDSWRAECQLVHALTGIGIDLTGITVTSMVKTTKGVWLAVDLIKGDQVAAPGSYQIRADTSRWPIGEHAWDIQYRRGSNKWSTETCRVTIVEDVTP